MTKKWYYRSWFVITMLIVFAPVGLFFMWLGGLWRVRTRWVVTAILVALYTGVGIAGALADEEGDQAQDTMVEAEQTIDAAVDAREPTETPEATDTPEPPEPTETLEPTNTPEPTPTLEWGENGPVTEETTGEALKDADELIRSVNLGEPEELTVVTGEGGIHIMVTYKVDDALGETDLLSIAGQTTFGAMHALFGNRWVGLVTVRILADWTDIYGSTEEEQTTWARLSRQTVDSRIDWGGLENRVYGDNKVMFCVADEMFIHPGIYNRLGDKGCLLFR